MNKTRATLAGKINPLLSPLRASLQFCAAGNQAGGAPVETHHVPRTSRSIEQAITQELPQRATGAQLPGPRSAQRDGFCPVFALVRWGSRRQPKNKAMNHH